MKAIVFAAGLGTRLYPLTESMPKALVEVGGKPMLLRVLEKLRDAGIHEIVINVHHYPDMIIDYLRSNNWFGLKIMISDERTHLLDTGGGILAARNYLDDGEPFIAHNADILTDFDLSEMITRHNESGADVTLLSADRSSSRYLLFDEAQRMVGWTNTKTGEVKPAGLKSDSLHRLAFGGVHVISPTVFGKLEEYRLRVGDVFSITPFYVEYCEKLDMRGYVPSESYHWFDVGRPETLEKARQLYRR